MKDRSNNAADPEGGRFSRRKLFGAGAAGGLGVALASGMVPGTPDVAVDAAAAAGVVPYFGDHQSGVATKAQQGLEFAAFDVVGTERSTVAELMQTWSQAAARMCRGYPVAELDDDLLAPPADSGEALDSGAANLTVTFGFGPSLFVLDGEDRFGLAHHMPAALQPLPAFAGDAIEAAFAGGDVGVQVCADDPLVAFHAIHNLVRLADGAAEVRWSQTGFARTSSTRRQQVTPRNVMGFKDGTINVHGNDPVAMANHVWAGSEGPSWMSGGTYMVARRIRILLEAWDRSSLGDQQQTIGRQKYSGAPLSGTNEFDPLDLTALDPSGRPLIPADSHVRLASAAVNGGAQLLRRGYSYYEGIDQFGELDAGLFFICYQRDPRRQFVPIQRRLASSDALNQYVRHVGSAVFACPPGASRGGWVGRGLLGTFG
jgi:deferrochelatase/peroxidase EfeB